jgi:hypothetical protein
MKTETLSPEPVTEDVLNAVLSYHFKSISEIVNDHIFMGFVQTSVSELIKNRYNRPAAPKGKKYKRDWYDRMSEQGNVNYVFFIKNIENIWLKKSSLSSQERYIIQYVCDKCLTQTLLEYANQVIE